MIPAVQTTQRTHPPQQNEYASLLQRVEPRPIRSKAEHQRMLSKFEEISREYGNKPSEALGQMVELLATLIERYEEDEYPIPDVAPHKLVGHLLTERGVSQAEFARALDCSRSSITNILSGKRSVSKAMAIKLSNYFRLPADLFIDA